MTRRVSAFALLLALLLGVLAPAAVSAETPPLPDTMAAAGDSITEAASTGGSLGADAPQNSWATGTNTTVNSHFLRLRTLNPNLIGQDDPTAVSGAKMVDLVGQMETLATVQPDYLTVLIGGNDLCTDTVGEMTSTGAFESQFRHAMRALLGWPAEDGAPEILGVSPSTSVYVVSIPDVYQLWDLFKNSFMARLVWASADICQSLLANPTSTRTEDEQRRLAVRERNIAYNEILARVCGEFPTRCRHDDNKVFETELQRSDVSGDYFHPSIEGQARLAEVSWNAGYWAAGASPDPMAPTADFTWSCTDLSCSFTDTSGDSDGSVTEWAWDFGDGGTSDLQHPTHTFSTGGTKSVKLTVIDDDGLTGSVTHALSVSEPAPPPAQLTPMSVADLDGAAATGRGQSWSATVTIRVVTDAGVDAGEATVSGSWDAGGSSSCTTDAAGSCSVTLNGINGKKTPSVIFTVTGISKHDHVYDSTANGDPDGDSDGTSIEVVR